MIRMIGTAAPALAAAATVASASPVALPKTCPSASIVSAALGVKATTPTATKNPYGVSCKYGTNALAPKVTFQQDTASTFAAGEKAAAAALPVVKVSHLGRSAWATKSGGSLYVFTGSYTIKILAPLVSLPKLEALARKLL